MTFQLSSDEYSELKRELRDLKIAVQTVLIDNPDWHEEMAEISGKVQNVSTLILKMTCEPVRADADHPKSEAEHLNGLFNGYQQSNPSNGAQPAQPMARIMSPAMNSQYINQMPGRIPAPMMSHPAHARTQLDLIQSYPDQIMNQYPNNHHGFGPFYQPREQPHPNWQKAPQNQVDPAIHCTQASLENPSLNDGIDTSNLSADNDFYPSFNIMDTESTEDLNMANCLKLIEDSDSSSDHSIHSMSNNEDYIESRATTSRKAAWVTAHNTDEGWENVKSSDKVKDLNKISKTPIVIKKLPLRKYDPIEWTEALTFDTALFRLRNYKDAHSTFIKEAFEHAMRQKTKLPHFVLIGMFKADLLTHEAFVTAFAELLGMIEDLIKTVPTVYAGLGMSLSTLVRGEVFCKEDLSKLYKTLKDAVRVKLILQVSKFTKKDAGKEILLN